MKVQKVMLYLGEGPRIFVKTAEQEAKNEGRPFLWKDVKKTLLECFLPAITEDIARMRLATLKQTGSVWEYTAEFQKLDRYIPNSDPADRIDRYKRGLKEQIQRLWLQQTTIQSLAKATSASVNTGASTSAPVISKLTQAISYAVQLEASIQQYRELSKTSYRHPYSNGPYQHKSAVINQLTISEDNKAEGHQQHEDKGDDKEPLSQGTLNHLNSESASRKPSPYRPVGMSNEKYQQLMKEKRCLACEEIGHRRADCPKLQPGMRRTASSFTNTRTTNFSSTQPSTSSFKNTKKEESSRQ
jgi:Retrotransposon gag protein